jgi:hypothetical protein
VLRETRAHMPVQSYLSTPLRFGRDDGWEGRRRKNRRYCLEKKTPPADGVEDFEEINCLVD